VQLLFIGLFVRYCIGALASMDAGRAARSAADVEGLL
jgi:hypothetical protein